MVQPRYAIVTSSIREGQLQMKASRCLRSDACTTNAEHRLACTCNCSHLRSKWNRSESRKEERCFMRDHFHERGFPCGNSAADASVNASYNASRVFSKQRTAFLLLRASM